MPGYLGFYYIAIESHSGKLSFVLVPAQIKARSRPGGFRAKPERERDVKNGEHHKMTLRPGEDSGAVNPYICSGRATVKARHYPSR